jgi:4-cresol dehydrogenase (hydroxylating) flavoprotein subunit
MLPERPPMRSDLAPALAAFLDAVGAEHVVTDPAALAAAGTATFATSQRVPAIVRPGSRAEVQACLQVANRFRVPVYPVSRGKNWGFGSRVPARDGAVLLDLGRMNRIVDFDEALAYVTVEPGVTFADLYAFLRAQGSRLFANTTGGSPHGSVVGNALERGDGAGPHGDRAGSVCALEVVLPTGEVVHTGHDRFAGARAAPLFQWGVGPSLDGLFSQSSLGVVTRLSLWLAPLPRSLSLVRFSVIDPARLSTMVDACRVLRQDGTLRNAVGIWNDYRVLSTRRQYPWELTGGATPLPRAVMDALKHEWGGGTWFGSTAIHAPTIAQGRAAAAHVERALRPYVDHLSIDARSGDPASGHELETGGDPAFLFAQGIPHEGSLRSVYWRKRAPPPDDPDPDRDRCGVIWAAPVLPFRGRDVAAAVRMLEEVMPAHGLEPLLAMVGQTSRVVYLIPLLVYDRDVPGADEAAMRCHDAIVAKLVEAGYPPYRLGVQSMDALPAPRDDHGALMERLKRALDPNDILAPGRYDFRTTWPSSR